jgi:ATP-binding cassette, subfamily A (ABC1), member 3
MLAVRGLSFGVKKGEVFTLLGVNGAGKSSSFKCLVGLEDVSEGDIQLHKTPQASVVDRPWLLHDIVGYCPQTDCILDGMTVRSTLRLFAKIVGYSEQ